MSKLVSEKLPVYVYCTLHSGGRYNDRYFAENIEKILPGRIRGMLVHHLKGDYPCLAQGKGCVHGEVVWLRPDKWSRVISALDQLEGYDASNEPHFLYIRRRVEVHLPGRARCLA